MTKRKKAIPKKPAQSRVEEAENVTIEASADVDASEPRDEALGEGTRASSEDEPGEVVAREEPEPTKAKKSRSKGKGKNGAGPRSLDEVAVWAKVPDDEPVEAASEAEPEPPADEPAEAEEAAPKKGGSKKGAAKKDPPKKAAAKKATSKKAAKEAEPAEAEEEGAALESSEAAEANEPSEPASESPSGASSIPSAESFEEPVITEVASVDVEMTVNLAGDQLPGRDDLDEPTVTLEGETLGNVDEVLAQRKHLKGLLEALVFASDVPINTRDLAKVADAPVKQVKDMLDELQVEYLPRGIHLDEVANGWVFRTSATYAPYVRDLTKEKPVRLSRAQVETMAIIAYRQPITRPEIDEVRGVDSGPVLKVLLERDLVRILGKRDEVGRPIIYGTTNVFLEFFGLKSLKDLPTLREFTELTDESKQAYEDELGENPDDFRRGSIEGEGELGAEPAAEQATENAAAEGTLTAERNDGPGVDRAEEPIEPLEGLDEEAAEALEELSEGIDEETSLADFGDDEDVERDADFDGEQTPEVTGDHDDELDEDVP